MVLWGSLLHGEYLLLRSDMSFASFGRIKVRTLFFTLSARSSNSRILIWPKGHQEKTRDKLWFSLGDPTENLEDQISFAVFGRVKVWTLLFTHFTWESNSQTAIQPKCHHQKRHLSVTFLMVTPWRVAMNFYKNAGELLPLVRSWNNDVSLFLKREPTPKTLAITY